MIIDTRGAFFFVFVQAGTTADVDMIYLSTFDAIVLKSSAKMKELDYFRKLCIIMASLELAELNGCDLLVNCTDLPANISDCVKN